MRCPQADGGCVGAPDVHADLAAVHGDRDRTGRTGRVAPGDPQRYAFLPRPRREGGHLPGPPHRRTASSPSARANAAA